MAVLAEALAARAKAVSGLYSLIGGATNTRFYMGKSAQNGAAPYVTASPVSDTRPVGGGSDLGIVKVRVQFNSFARTETAALALDAQVYAAFNRYRGTSASLVIQDVFPEEAVEPFFDPTAKLWKRPRDFFVWYEGAGT